MPATKIMIIRHGEKPVSGFLGVDVHGKNNSRSLIVRGWQRAGALVGLFAPARGPLQSAELATPQFLYAANPAKGVGDSKRPYETILPLSKRLQLAINQGFAKLDAPTLVPSVEACDGVVLVAWEHGQIVNIANLIMPNSKTIIPQKWPSNRFDVVWVFDWNSTTGAYEFSQVPQCLLAGDLNTPIPAKKD